jgi:hypothetical protein
MCSAVSLAWLQTSQIGESTILSRNKFVRHCTLPWTRSQMNITHVYVLERFSKPHLVHIYNTTLFFYLILFCVKFEKSQKKLCFLTPSKTKVLRCAFSFKWKKGEDHKIVSFGGCRLTGTLGLRPSVPAHATFGAGEAQRAHI